MSCCSLTVCFFFFGGGGGGGREGCFVLYYFLSFLLSVLSNIMVLAIYAVTFLITPCQYMCYYKCGDISVCIDISVFSWESVLVAAISIPLLQAVMKVNECICWLFSQHHSQWNVWYEFLFHPLCNWPRCLKGDLAYLCFCRKLESFMGMAGFVLQLVEEQHSDRSDPWWLYIAGLSFACP